MVRFLAGLFGHGLRRITPWTSHADGIDCSPDGKRIVYSAPAFSQDSGKSSNVYTMKIDGSDVVQLTHESDNATNDGAEVARRRSFLQPSVAARRLHRREKPPWGYKLTGTTIETTTRTNVGWKVSSGSVSTAPSVRVRS